MTTKEYAKALYALFKESPRADLGKDFTRYLREKGSLGILPGVLREIVRLEKEEARSKTCEIIVSDSADAHSAELHAKAFIKEKNGGVEGWNFEIRVDPSLIGGYIVRTPQSELDMSDKRGLHRLYERLRTTT